MKRIVLLLSIAFACAQEREDRTLLNWDQMRAIINEVSGERGLDHVLELVPYPRVRSQAEYESHFRESEVMARFAKEYGYSNVEIESFPGGQRIWHAHEAQLWEVKPQLRKIYDVHDVAIAIASGSESGNVTAELVDVGGGARAEDYAGKDVKGKIVLGSARAGVLRSLAVSGRGAVGVVSYAVMYPEGYSDIGMSQFVGFGSAGGSKQPVFGWAVSPRVGRELAARLAAGEKITLRSIVKAEAFPARSEVVQAVIPGDGSSDQEIAVSAHLYEGYQKQGANDDASGCAMTLEMGRTYLRLVQEGRLPKPRRTIRFLWVPEISGTRALAQQAPGPQEEADRRLEFRYGRLEPGPRGQFLGAASHPRHVPHLPQRRERQRPGVRRQHQPRAPALPAQRLRVHPAGAGPQRHAAIRSTTWWRSTTGPATTPCFWSKASPPRCSAPGRTPGTTPPKTPRTSWIRPCSSGPPW